MSRFLFAAALVGAATMMMTSDAEAGVFGRRCNTGCRVVRQVTTCQTVQVCQPVQVCVETCQVQTCKPVRTAVKRAVHKILPPYRSCCNDSACCTVVQGSVVQGSVVEQSYPAPTEPIPPTPNVLPAAPIESP